MCSPYPCIHSAMIGILVNTFVTQCCVSLDSADDHGVSVGRFASGFLRTGKRVDSASVPILK